MPSLSIKGKWLLRAAVVLTAAVILRMILIGNEGTIRALSPGCYLRKYTGFYCAGCGGTRAFFAFLKGDFALSWRMNPLFLVGLGSALLFGSMTVWDRLPSGRPRRLSWIRITAAGGWFVLGMLILFSILRNLPCYPFTLLSPR